MADALEALAAASAGGSSGASAAPLPADGVALVRLLTRFALIAELYGDDHRTLVETRRQGRRREVEVRLVCLDAARALARQRALFGASVMFSATLAPATFYRDALGLPAETPVLALTSPFDPAHALHCVVPWIDTRFRAREETARSTRCSG